MARRPRKETEGKGLKMVFEPDLSFPEDEERTRFQGVIVWLASQTPARVTVRQLLAFLVFAEGDVTGKPETMKNLRDLRFPDSKFGNIFDSSLTRSYAIFFAPEKSEPDGLNWLYQIQDTEDKRRQWIRLTDDGKIAYKMILKMLGTMF